MKPIIPFVVLAICLNINCEGQVNTSNATIKKTQQSNKKMNSEHFLTVFITHLRTF